MQILRTKLYFLIRKSGLSIRQLSIKSGVRRASILRFLAGGNIHLVNLQKLLVTFGYSLDFLKSQPTKIGPSSTQLKNRIHVRQGTLAKFCRKHGIRYLALFGSVLRSDFQDRSDVDILIDLKHPVTFFGLEDIERELKRLFVTSHPLDIITLGSLSPLLADEVIQTSETLYEKTA